MVIEYPHFDGVRLRLDIAYVGTSYHGWQIQTKPVTVQGELRDHLSRLLGRPVVPVAAGRTDSGVHARGQVAHLTVRNSDEAERVARALPRMCDGDIQVLNVRRVSPDFNARFSAQSRRYAYHLGFGRDVFYPYRWYVYQPVEPALMDQAARDFLGKHDFTSFCKAASLKAAGNFCEVSHCAFEWGANSAILHVKANRFLHHMVRNIAGMLVEIGRGELPVDAVPRALEAKSRRAIGRMAPAKGLFLEEVEYPEQLLDPGYWDPNGYRVRQALLNVPTPRSDP
ncbi:MAG: tRNA pseudouridine38-40 synthase [Candidatus Krumholzibacteriia bacterium]|jgi:tRNA pseudouridine38-40 synthase